MAGIWLGLTFLLNALVVKYKLPKFSRFCSTIAAVVPTCVILTLNNCSLLNIKSITAWRHWLVVLLTAIVTALIISKNDVENPPKGKDLLLYGLDGILMEIPQPMMMQSFLWYVLARFNVHSALYISVFINAAVWCVGIVIQNLIFKIQLDKKTFREIISSMFFSVCVGYILAETGFILFTMAAHFAERILSTIFRQFRKSC